jgi:hypothetical protein
MEMWSAGDIFQGIESGSINVLHRFDVVPSSLSP